MFAGLYGWFAQRTSTRRKMKRLVPPNGNDYEQFNVAMLMFVWVVCNYGFNAPQPTTQDALAWLLGETPLLVWRVFLITTASAALLGSYVRRLHGVGLGAQFLGGSVWSAVLFIGWLGDMSAPALASSVLYGFFARHAYHLARYGA